MFVIRKTKSINKLFTILENIFKQKIWDVQWPILCENKNNGAEIGSCDSVYNM